MKRNQLLYLLIGFCSLANAQMPGSGVYDIEGNYYDTVIIDGREWMQQNLRVTHYRDGMAIPESQDAEAWSSTYSGTWCDMLNGYPIYGKTYNWAAVNNSRGLAPEGWHVPNQAEWDALSASQGGDAVAGIALKSTQHWGVSVFVTPTNASGFTAVPNGLRGEWGTFNATQNAYFWTTDRFPNNNRIIRYLPYDSTSFYEMAMSPSVNYGFSVRCIKNQILANTPFHKQLVAVYPNPATGRINIVAVDFKQNANYTICDLLGKKIRQGNLEDKSVDIADLQSGFYLLTISNEDHLETVKFLKK